MRCADLEAQVVLFANGSDAYYTSHEWYMAGVSKKMLEHVGFGRREEPEPTPTTSGALRETEEGGREGQA